MVSDIFGRAHYGSISGALALGANGARALAPIGASLLYGALGSYEALFGALAGSLAVVSVPGRRDEHECGSLQLWGRAAGSAMTLNRGVVAMCAAQFCAQIGAFSVAALLPTLIAVWSLTNTEAGWISGIYYAAYTLAVPLLSSLTDRVDPKRIYLGSVALTAVAFAGFAWAANGSGRRWHSGRLMGAGLGRQLPCRASRR